MKPENISEYLKTSGKGAGKLFAETIRAEEAPFQPIFTTANEDTDDFYSFNNYFCWNCTIFYSIVRFQYIRFFNKRKN